MPNVNVNANLNDAKGSLVEREPEGYLSESRRDRILSALATKCDNLIARVKAKRDALLKKEYVRLRNAPTGEAKSLKSVIDKCVDKKEELKSALDEAGKARAAEKEVADKAYHKTMSEAEAARQEAVNAANKAYKEVADEASKAINASYAEADKAFDKVAKENVSALKPVEAELAEASESLNAAGYVLDAKERLGMRPVKRSKDENVLGGPLAEDIKAKAAVRIEAITDVMDSMAAQVEVSGTSAAEAVGKFEATVKSETDSVKSLFAEESAA